MSDTLGTISFARLLDICLEDYYTKGKIFEIDEKDFYKGKNDNLGINLFNEYLLLSDLPVLRVPIPNYPRA